MKKRISKIFLTTVSIVMILLIIFLSYITKEDITIEDISGDRNALGDMNIVYNRRKGIYETDKVIISKDNEEVKKYTKEGSYGFTPSNENIKNRNLLEKINDKSEICENNNEITTVSLSYTYSHYYEEEMVAYINEKDKKRNSINEYEIKVDDKVDLYENSDYKVLPIRNNDNIYLAVMASVYDNEIIENEDEYIGNNEEMYKQTYLSLYKLNLSSKQSKCIINKSYKSNKIYTDGNMGFVRGNVAYFVVYSKDNEDEKMNTCLFAFDVISKDINIINLGINNKEITNYHLNDDELLLSCETDEVSGTIKTIVVDLNTNKVKINNEIKIKSSRKNNKYVIDMRRDKNNTYLIMGDSEYEDTIEYGDLPEEANYYIYVINEKDNNILYSGKITEKHLYDINFGILKKEEI